MYISLRFPFFSADEEAFREMIWFCYDGKLCQCRNRVQGGAEFVLKVLHVGYRFLCKPVIRKALSELRALPETCILADTFFKSMDEQFLAYREVQDLVNHFRRVLEREYQDVSSWLSPRFKSLKLAFVTALLQSEDLLARSEEHNFDGILSWVKSSYRTLHERRDVMLQLASNLRFPVMSGEYLQKILSLPKMKECKKLVMLAVWYRAFSPTKQLRSRDKEGLEAKFSKRRGVPNGTRLIRYTFQKDRVQDLEPFARPCSGPFVRVCSLVLHACLQSPDNEKQSLLDRKRKTEEQPKSCAAILVNYNRVSNAPPRADHVTLLWVTVKIKTWPEGDWEHIGSDACTIKEQPAKSGSIGEAWIVCDETWSDFLQSKRWFNSEGQLHVQIETMSMVSRHADGRIIGMVN